MVENIYKVWGDFLPFVKSLARRYMGRGAEYEDLVQEGGLILWRLLSDYQPEDGDVPLYLWRNLPYRVRDRAEVLRRTWCPPVEVVPELAFHPARDAGFILAELRAGLTDPVDRRIYQLLADGLTQAEIAHKIGLSQQAVSKRLSKWRKEWRES